MSDTVATRTRVLTDGSLASFRQIMRGPVLTPADEEYGPARQIWNAMIDRRPCVIARCLDVADVRAAVLFAREHDLVLSIRGGGHNIAGLARCDGGLTIDCLLMKEVGVDARSCTAVAQPGVTWAGETQRVGLATTGGAVSTTGIAGLTLGGGLGWLMGRCGLCLPESPSASRIRTPDL